MGTFEDWNKPNYEPGSVVYPPSMNNPGEAAPCSILSVSDVERLEKAGVKMDWGEMKYQVRPDPVERHDMFDCHKLLRPLVARLKQGYDIHRSDKLMEPRMAPFHLSAAVHGEKVYIFVAPLDQPPIILEDDTHLYPSDALMAKLHLMDKFYKDGK